MRQTPQICNNMGTTGRTLKGQHHFHVREGNLVADFHRTALYSSKNISTGGDALLYGATPTLRLLPRPSTRLPCRGCGTPAECWGETLPGTLPAHEGWPCHRSGDTLGPGIANRTAASQASGSYAPGLSEGNLQDPGRNTHFGFCSFCYELRIFFPLAAFRHCEVSLFCLSSCLPGTRAGTKPGPVTWGTSSH